MLRMFLVMPDMIIDVKWAENPASTTAAEDHPAPEFLWVGTIIDTLKGSSVDVMWTNEQLAAIFALGPCSLGENHGGLNPFADAAIAAMYNVAESGLIGLPDNLRPIP